MELYRYLVDDFVVQYCRGLNKKDFIVKSEDFSTKRKGKRKYPNDPKTSSLVSGLNRYFQIEVGIPRIRIGNTQEIETLINEETLLLGMYLRDEKKDRIPRICSLT